MFASTVATVEHRPMIEPLRHACGVPLPGLRLPASASLSLASCWPRPQQLLPVSAAGGGRRRCSRRERHWRVGQAHAGRVKLNLYRKQQCPATKASSSLTRNMVPQLLPSVAGHYFLRYIRLHSSRRKLTDMPMAPPLGELAGASPTERARTLPNSSCTAIVSL